MLCCVRVTTYELMIYVASSKFLDPLKFDHHNVKLIETIQIIAGGVYLECNNLLHQISYSFVSKRKCAHCIVYSIHLALCVESNCNLWQEQGKILFKMHVHVITALMCCHIIGIITIRKSIIEGTDVVVKVPYKLD